MSGVVLEDRNHFRNGCVVFGCVQNVFEFSVSADVENDVECKGTVVQVDRSGILFGTLLKIWSRQHAHDIDRRLSLIFIHGHERTELVVRRFWYGEKSFKSRVADRSVNIEEQVEFRERKVGVINVSRTRCTKKYVVWSGLFSVHPIAVLYTEMGCELVRPINESTSKRRKVVGRALRCTVPREYALVGRFVDYVIVETKLFLGALLEFFFLFSDALGFEFFLFVYEVSVRLHFHNLRQWLRLRFLAVVNAVADVIRDTKTLRFGILKRLIFHYWVDDCVYGIFTVENV